jgi:hypothetical protein
LITLKAFGPSTPYENGPEVIFNKCITYMQPQVRNKHKPKEHIRLIVCCTSKDVDDVHPIFVGPNFLAFMLKNWQNIRKMAQLLINCNLISLKSGVSFTVVAEN